MLLEARPDTELVGEAVTLAAEHAPDVVLMNLRMPVPASRGA